MCIKNLRSYKKVENSIQQHQNRRGKNTLNKWEQLSKSQSSSWSNEKSKNLKVWQKAKMTMLNTWANDKLRYEKSIPVYKQNLIVFDSFASSNTGHRDNKEENTDYKVLPSSDHKLTANSGGIKIIPHAFTHLVKDQGKRPTCSAFATTRALEIVLARSGGSDRLSEQYIYYASKPKCQSSLF